YSSLIEELGRQADKLNQQLGQDADPKLFKDRINDLNIQLKKLQKLTNDRSLKLMELKKFHEFYRESSEFLNWIATRKQLLLKDDFGKDFEHCGILQSRFVDLKRSILANEERYNQCVDFAKGFDKSDDENRFSTNIE